MVDFNSTRLLENLEGSHEYNIGNELNDNAHKKLFGVIRKVAVKNEQSFFTATFSLLFLYDRIR